MYPWMNQGGFGNYNPGTGQWSQPQQPMNPQMQEMQQRGNIQNRMGNLNSRITKLQEQYKGAGTEQQAGIQSRIDAMQGNVGRLQGKLDAGGGANRIGMDFRKERRKAKNAGTYDPTAQQGGYDMRNQSSIPGFSESMGGSRGYLMPDGSFAGAYGGMNYGGGASGGWQNPFGAQYGNQRFANPNAGDGDSTFGPNYGGYGMPMGAGQMSDYGMGRGYAGQYNPSMGGGQYFDEWGIPRTVPNAQQMQEISAAGAAHRQAQGGNQTGLAEQGRMPTSAPNPGPQQGGWDPYTQGVGMGNMFDTGWGRLVASSTGNQNVMQLENDPSKLFHYDPTAQDGPGARGGWKSMTPESYSSYGDYNYQDPRNFAGAGMMMQRWAPGKNGGLGQGVIGTGSYA